MTVTIDRLPGRCEVLFVFSGPITTAYARNIDTGATGPLTAVDESRALEWAVLDPEGIVEGVAA